MPAFHQDIARSETLYDSSDVDYVVQRIDLRGFQAGVFEQQSSFGNVWCQNGGQREEAHSEMVDRFIWKQLGSTGCDHDRVNDGSGSPMLLQSIRHCINSACGS